MIAARHSVGTIAVASRSTPNARRYASCRPSATLGKTNLYWSADRDARHVAGPVPPAVARQRKGAGPSRVEVAGDRHVRRERGPDRNVAPPVVRDGIHAGPAAMKPLSPRF